MFKKLVINFFVLTLLFVPFAYPQPDKLTKEQVLDIALNKAKDLGYKVEDMDILYDENNAAIKKHLLREGVSTYNVITKEWVKDLATTPEKEYPELSGKDYQSVYFGPKEMRLGGDLWVFIDRDSGKIIKFVRGK
jgi:hypothetical protein